MNYTRAVGDVVAAEFEQSKFLKHCGQVLRQTEGASPEGVAPSDWRAFALDLLLRIVFLNLAEPRGSAFGPGERLEALTVRMVLAKMYTQQKTGGTQGIQARALRQLYPVSFAVETAWRRAEEAEGKLETLFGSAHSLWSQVFATRQQAGDKIDPRILALIVEHLGPDRRRRGAYYTPDPIVDTLCREVLALRHPELRPMLMAETLEPTPMQVHNGLIGKLRGMRVLDPACGGGAFLIGMARVLDEVFAYLGDSWNGQVVDTLFGADLDPLAVAVCRLRLWLTMTAREQTLAAVDNLCIRIRVNDSLGQVGGGDDSGKWDIVVTNPPYGVKAAPGDRDLIMGSAETGRQSRDAYGLFLARTPYWLADSGVGGLVVADTWRTIRSHRPLRKKLLPNFRLVHVIDLPNRTFAATVGAEIVVLQKEPPVEGDQIRTADLRHLPASPPSTVQKALRQHLIERRPSNPDVVHEFPQQLCRRLTNCPVFIASPSIFERMLDPAYVKLGQVAAIRHGLTTGAVQRFVTTQSNTESRYRLADRRLILRADELASLSEQERRYGFDPRRFDGRRLVPYDKGGRSRTSDGWLPCYWSPTDYFIDWSEESVAAMRMLPGFRHDGRQYYFCPGITFSHTGYYAPTFRVGSAAVFDTAGSTLFPREWDRRLLLGLLNSRSVRYIFKNFINHSVNTAEGPLKEIPLPKPEHAGSAAGDLIQLVDRIIDRQHTDRSYPFHRNEQPEIDRIVYGLYGMNAAEREEIERWHRRRYPRLFAD